MEPQRFEISQLAIGVFRVVDAWERLIRKVFPCAWTFRAGWPIAVETLEPKYGLLDRVRIMQEPLGKDAYIECALCSRESNYPGTPVGGKFFWNGHQISFLVLIGEDSLTLCYAPSDDYLRWVDPGQLPSHTGRHGRPILAEDFRSKTLTPV